MKIKRKFNNNVALSENENQVEVILLGRGICVNRNVGDEIDASTIEKEFVLNQKNDMMVELFNQIPPQHFFLSNKIIVDAQKELDVTFNDSIYVGLTDHINYALTRFKEHIPLKNAMLWEIQKFYPKEYLAAKNAIKTIHYYEGIWLNDDEAGYIAIHFVNGMNDYEMNDSYKIAEIVKQTIKIIKYYFKVNLDETSESYKLEAKTP